MILEEKLKNELSEDKINYINKSEPPTTKVAGF